MKHEFTFCGTTMHALASGALFWPDEDLLVVSDLHLGKSERIARRSGQMLPPYDTMDTLTKFETSINATAASRVICLGDSFDDLTAGAALPENITQWITRLMAGRDWVWIEGNHDPGPLDIGGSHRAEILVGALTFRHIAQPDAKAEVSGHYHPKARISVKGRAITQRCFLFDAAHLILPAFGTYTGGLYSTDPALLSLMRERSKAILIGPCPVEIPMPRR